MASFDDVLKSIRDSSASERDKGARFEALARRYLLSEPMYAELLEQVWLWADSPPARTLGERDVGIDLVAKARDGGYWAVQCKCYAEGHRVTKEDMDTFISTSGRTFDDGNGSSAAFSNRLVIATTDDWTENAEESMRGQAVPVQVVRLSALRESQVDWGSLLDGLQGEDARTKKTIRPHQQRALEDAMEHYREHDRGTLVMACGTGKTFTSLKIAEALLERDGPLEGQPCVLFLAPSISLVSQTVREWTSNSEESIFPICVCSDPTASKRNEDEALDGVMYLGMPATTDPGRIAFAYQTSSCPVVVFSTYQSIDAVIAAQRAGLPEFSLIVCDEAHRTTGAMKSEDEAGCFTKVHDNSLVRGRRRLYMTATPRIYGAKGKEDAKKAAVVLFSMDDESIYGAQFHRLGFGRAVEQDLLSDYKVLVLTAPVDGMPSFVRRWCAEKAELDVDTNVKVWGCLKALAKVIYGDDTVNAVDPGPMRSAVAFCRSIKVSKKVSEIFNGLASYGDSPIRLEMRHIDGGMSSVKRDERLAWLKEGSEGCCHALTNVRCLSEGVDVPALDAVMFLDPKSSVMDIVQSVGRVMRKAEGKRYGYIIIPIVISEGTDPMEALDSSDAYDQVWKVLRALRSHDDRLDAEINKLTFGKSSEHIHIGTCGGGSDGLDEGEAIVDRWPWQFTLDDFRDAMTARLVTKVGDREYIEHWAEKVAEITPDLTEKLREICISGEGGSKRYKAPFRQYLKGLRECVNDNVSEESAINMLVQQIVTKPIFERLFAKDGFAMQNSVSGYIDRMLAEIDAKEGLKEIQGRLDDFYDSVELTLDGIDTTEGKQKVITALYEKFFKNAFPKDQAINGVVYTPQEAVDFILNSVVAALRDEFGADINDEGVNVLDPFTGTGTFIARLIESGHITRENLERKYRHELFANEITLLAYYIAVVNIENTYARVSGAEEYVPFDNILLTDTFNIEEICRERTVQTDLSGEEYFVRNKGRIRRENDSKITVIVGNPPYGGRQKSANDDAKKRRYEAGIDGRVSETYLDPSLFSAKNPNINSVYDNYVRAFRWATDRIGDGDGVISFITPNWWLESGAFEGFRKTLESEFSRIFVFDLRGNQRMSDWRAEGEKFFGEGSKVGICITLLVKKAGHAGKAEIRYHRVGDGLKTAEKKRELADSRSFSAMLPCGLLEVLEPKDNGDWIIERNPVFDTLVPLCGDKNKKFEKFEDDSIFTGFSLGYATGHDSWSFNFSKNQEICYMSAMLEEYALQTRLGIIERSPEKIAWNRSLENLSKKKATIEFDETHVIVAAYRPFCKLWFYGDKDTIAMNYQMPRIYPKDDTENLAICVSGPGDKKPFSCLLSNTHADLHFVGSCQCLPLYWYESSASSLGKGQTTLFDEGPAMRRHDGISDFALGEARSRYGPGVSKEDVFYYVYGYLHSPDYRAAFFEDLKKSLPRVGFVDSAEEFWAFSEAGRRLADLHLNYEAAPACGSVRIVSKYSVDELLADDGLLRVEKMRLDEEGRRLVYNVNVAIEDIPADAFRYVVNGRSALGWLVDQYRVTVDRESGIKNDPNGYAGGAYIFKLVLSVITVSVETMRIVDGLPRLSFDGSGGLYRVAGRQSHGEDVRRRLQGVLRGHRQDWGPRDRRIVRLDRLGMTSHMCRPRSSKTRLARRGRGSWKRSKEGTPVRAFCPWMFSVDVEGEVHFLNPRVYDASSS